MWVNIGKNGYIWVLVTPHKSQEKINEIFKVLDLYINIDMIS